MNAPQISGALPVVPWLQAGEAPQLAGSRCLDCGTVMPGTRRVCAACGSRDRTEPVPLGQHGRLLSFTVVHRSFPGVKTPFTSVIVELESGCVIRGTLVDAEDIAPEAMTVHMAMALVYRDTGQKSADGLPFLSYFFTPARQA